MDDDSNDYLNSSDTAITVYEWDHRNRLVAVTDYTNYANYLTELERHAAEAAEPGRWIPWNYRQTLAEPATSPATVG